MRNFDPIRYLASDQAIDEWLEIAAERNDEQYYLDCLADAMMARCINQFVDETGIEREEIYKIFSKTVKPSPVIVSKITAAFKMPSLTKNEVLAKA
jgi:probable addiction module antidote protein